MIKFDNVSFVREQQQQILKEITWHVEAGQNWAILGLNGSGKTSLLKLITGYHWPSSGSLEVLGEVFGHTSIPALQRKIGWVSADLHYKLKDHFLAEDIVLSGKFASIGLHQVVTPAEQAEAQALLIACGGQELLGKAYGVMSQGQRQITLIARALMAKPELLILDEPCNGLDLFAREELLARIEMIAAQPAGPTLLFVTHYTEELLPCFDHLMLLKAGSIFQQDARQTLLTQATLAAFYEKSVQLVAVTPQRLMVIPDSET